MRSPQGQGGLDPLPLPSVTKFPIIGTEEEEDRNEKEGIKGGMKEGGKNAQGKGEENTPPCQRIHM